MCLTEYDEERVLQSIRQEEFEFGLEEGRKQERKNSQKKIRVLKARLQGKTEEEIAQEEGIPVEEVKKILEE